MLEYGQRLNLNARDARGRGLSGRKKFKIRSLRWKIWNPTSHTLKTRQRQTLNSEPQLKWAVGFSGQDLGHPIGSSIALALGKFQYPKLFYTCFLLLKPQAPVCPSLKLWNLRHPFRAVVSTCDRAPTSKRSEESVAGICPIPLQHGGISLKW